MLEYEAGRLLFEGKSLQALAEESGTPFFLLSEARIKANYHALLRGLSRLGGKVTVRYCAKTNNESSLLGVLARTGCHLLASHPAEVELALRCGFSPERIAYQRPVLKAEDLRRVMESGVTFLHAHNLQDLGLMEKTASELGLRVRTSLRLRVSGRRARLSPIDLLPQRLGFDEAEALAAARRIRGSRWLTLSALNFHGGTQQESARNYIAPLRRAFALAADIRRLVGIELGEINLGGGIPSGSIRRSGLGSSLRRLRDSLEFSDSPEPRERFCARLAELFRREVERAGALPPPAIAIEPGRSIAGDAAVLVTRVHGVQGRWAMVDASRNFLGESPLLFARRILVVLDPAEASRARRYYHISGSNMNSTDVIDLWRRLPVLGRGDLLAFCDAGAYSISRSSRYAGLSPAVYLAAEDGSLKKVRRAEGLSDLASCMEGL